MENTFSDNSEEDCSQEEFISAGVAVPLKVTTADLDVIEILDTELVGNVTNFIDKYMKGPPHIFTVTPNFIKQLMSADEIFRGKDGKFVGWPLLREEEIFAFMLYFVEAKFNTYMPQQKESNDKDISHVKIPNNSRKELLTAFPLIDEIIEFGKGHIIAAGGAISSALSLDFYYPTRANDCDFFLCGFKPEEIDQAGILVENVIIFLQNKYESFLEKDLIMDDKKFVILRSKNTVTVLFPPYQINEDTQTTPQKLQFVMRAYPTTGNMETDISMVIGGFDLFSCSVAYYNKQFYATYAGAFALATLTNIIMTSRFSTSMIHRIRKYSKRNYGVLFPGTSREKMARHSFVAKLAYHQNKENISIELPYIKIFAKGKYTHSTEFTETDYGATEASTYYMALGNLRSIIEEKEDQYCITGDTWDEVFYCSLFSKAPHSTMEQVLEKHIKSLKRSRNLANVGDYYLFSKIQSLRNILRKTFNRILEIELHECISKKTIPDSEILVSLFKQVDIEKLGMLYKAMMKLEKRTGNGVSLEIENKKFKDLLNNGITNIYNELILMDEDSFAEFCECMKVKILNHIEGREKAIIDEMTGKHFIDSKNPTRQHTASHNPTIISAKAWYGEENHVSFRAGFPDEIYFYLKTAFSPGGMYSKVTVGIFKTVLLPYYARAWAEGVCENLKATVMRNFKLNMQYRYYKCAERELRHKTIDKLDKVNLATQPFLYTGHDDKSIRDKQKIPKITVFKIVRNEKYRKLKAEEDEKRRIEREERKIKLKAKQTGDRKFRVHVKRNNNNNNNNEEE